MYHRIIVLSCSTHLNLLEHLSHECIGLRGGALPAPKVLAPRLISIAVIGWWEMWLCVLRDAPLPESRRLPTAKTRKRAQRVSATPHLLYPRLSSLTALNSNARPITATHLLSTQRTPQYIQRFDREEDSRADSDISSIHSCPPSRCNSSTPSLPNFYFVITDHQPLRAKEASVCSCDSATNWGIAICVEQISGDRP